MKKVIVGMGIPGSGKTAVLKPLALRYGYFYVCPDEIRAEITGDAGDQSKNREVWEITYKRVEQAVSEGRTVVVDATFANGEQRKTFLEFLRKIGVQKIAGLYVNTQLEVAKERNLARERKVPEHVIEKMNTLVNENAPGLDDGFDAFFTLDEHHAMQSSEIKNEEGEKNKRV